MIDIDTGVNIIVNSWLAVKKDELIHIIADETHLKEVEAFSKWANGNNAMLKITILPSGSIQNGEVIEKMADVLINDNVIIGATDNSFITSDAVKKAIDNGARFLSLPLSCTNGTSLLENDFIKMNTKEARKMGHYLKDILTKANTIRVTTKLGTDISFSIKDRRSHCFYGEAIRKSTVSSASFECYIAPKEDSANGVLYLDGSFGYLGLVNSPIKIIFKDGKLISAKSEDDGADKLINYIKSFNDETMYKPGEFGIGLNKLSKCRGVCYIEDESVYSTFHIGMGRNITLGGSQDAKGHFDIVTHKPTIYADDTMIMKDGEILY